ncbi:MAG: DUF1934 domain-containing protein [Clostridium sp.]|nr:DUF1934 domain-containing protein [Clostridium sp.]
MQKVLLEIIGAQRIDNQRDKMELTTVATLDENDSTYIIKYNEEQEPPLNPVNVCVTINKNEKCVEMTRSGAYDSCLVIEKSKRNLCHYGTEFGDILMGISGHNIDTEYNGNQGHFHFSYDIDINGALASRNEVKMNVIKQIEA